MSAFEIRRDATRGVMRNHWLEARFSFPFADHVDPRHPRFGPLLALNEDRVQPGTGFPMHPHRDLEIVMLPRRGAIEHHDSQGRHMRVQPGELQWMRAGRGISHRQWNASASEIDHHFQLWFEPSMPGLAPAVQRIAYATPAAGAWRVLISRGGNDGAVDIGVDVQLALGVAQAGRPIDIAARAAGGLYLHLMDGCATVHAAGAPAATLQPGDALVCFDRVPALQLQTHSSAALMRIDTAAVDPRTGRTLASLRPIPHLQESLS